MRSLSLSLSISRRENWSIERSFACINVTSHLYCKDDELSSRQKKLMGINELLTGGLGEKDKSLSSFLSCPACGETSRPIDETAYYLPYELHDNEVFVCEPCKTAFVLFFGDNNRVEKQQLSFNALFHRGDIPF